MLVFCYPFQNLDSTHHSSFPPLLLSIQHEYDEVVRWYSHLATEHSDLVQFVESIGETDGGLAMPAVHITASDDPERHKIYFQCQIHARELQYLCRMVI